MVTVTVTGDWRDLAKSHPTSTRHPFAGSLAHVDFDTWVQSMLHSSFLYVRGFLHNRYIGARIWRRAGSRKQETPDGETLTARP